MQPARMRSKGANGSTVVDMEAAVEVCQGWAGKLRRALGGADVVQAREAMREIGGTIVLRPHEARTATGSDTRREGDRGRGRRSSLSGG